MYQWAVIGAGPAGIAAVGKLLDFGILGKNILWIDPHFKVGDFGTIWRNVPSNTQVKLFLKFLAASKSFDYAKKGPFPLNNTDHEKTCELGLMADPLQAITDSLRQTVASIKDSALEVLTHDRSFQIKFKKDAAQTKNIILATGATPKNLNYPSIQTIPLEDALDNARIQKYIKANDQIAVFGSSHSAILVLRHLVDTQVKRIVNFYRSPLRYAVYLNDWILFDDTGLKGTTADWARQHIDGQWPKNLERYYSNEENLEHHLPQCNKAIYAIGFERRLLPIIQNVDHMNYVEQCGIISPGLFGLGIGFPEAKYNPYGLLEYRVGLWKFMDYLERVMPVWLKYPF